MLSKYLSKIFGSRNERLLKRLRAIVEQINGHEAALSALSDADLRAKTAEFRQRLADGASLDDLLPEAFAAVREAARRVLGMRHFDVQLIGGMVLNAGKIAEMRTGEGKTLVATLAAYLNALPGKGVHVVTVNDYLARRDADWMGRVYGFLGLSTGVIHAGQSSPEKRAAYAADITYGTNNEFGFDYLRDNMAFRPADKVQRGLSYAIVDEVDSILIDEARTPLIISGPVDEKSNLYFEINKLIPRLRRQEAEDGPGDFTVDEKAKQVYLTEEGHQNVEDLMLQTGLIKEGDSLYSAANIRLMHHLNAALRAHILYHRDVEYIVKDGTIVIVDEFTGRTMPGRRWSEGLHQAIEAKEGVPIQNENQTLASITFQNYFRLYGKLSGMTGTADTEAYEFQQIYGLEVVVIPTHRQMVRKDMGDLVYLTTREKYDAIIQDIADCHKRGQPALVGTTSIEISEYLSKLLRKDNIRHEVLNAKQHQREAEIVAQAGRPGAVTIATNMAGRGTDIVLGGSLEAELHHIAEDDVAAREAAKAEWKKRHEQVKASGGLYVIGSERHESRRIDNQLRGRSGRQGDPGATRFYLSLDDTLMRIFAPPSMRGLLQKLGMKEDEALEARMVTRSIETAQRKVEAHNFDIRKNLLEYDNVANDQRKAIYELRDELMGAAVVTPMIDDLRRDVVDAVCEIHVPAQSPEELWNLDGLEEAFRKDFAIQLPLRKWLDEDRELNDRGIRARIVEVLAASYADKKAKIGGEVLEHFEKETLLRVIDTLWREHLASMDYLRLGIHLRGYAQKDPKQEYKREAFTMFNDMLARFKHEVISRLSRIQILTEAEVAALEEARRNAVGPMEFQHAEASSAVAPDAAPPPELPPPAAPPRQLTPPQRAPQVETYAREMPKVGRNDPCPCGSGKKYKQCHGTLS